MFSKTIVFLIVYVLSDLAYGRNERRFRDDYTYLDEGHGFYKIHMKPRTWFEAKKECELEGASLFFPENDLEAEAVVEHWKQTEPSCERMLLGMSELMVRGEFITIDGRPVTEVYNKWKPGEPNHLNGNENCVNWHTGGVINDCPCDYEDAFICKKSLETVGWNPLCNMPYLDYTFYMSPRKCYKLHTTPLTWDEAKARCETELTQLAVITNQKEADSIANLIEFSPTPRTTGNYMRGVYHLGFHNKYNEGWRTVKDVPYTVSPEAWWGNYQPQGSNQCGSMFFNGRLNNIDCDTKSFFVCEHEADSANVL